jgi:hypothetical protein
MPFLMAWISSPLKYAVRCSNSVKFLDRAQTPFGVNLLTVNAAQAHGVQAKASFLRAHIRGQMKLTCRMTVHMAIQARNAETS